MGLTLMLCMVLCLFQKELERARLEQACATSEKRNLEKRLLQQESDQTELHTSYSDLEVARLKAEIEACIRDSGSHIWLEFQIQNYIFDKYVQLFIFTKWFWIQVTLFWWCMCYAQRLKMLNERKKTTTMHSGIRETAITQTFMLRLFLNNHNALWHVKICHDA